MHKKDLMEKYLVRGRLTASRIWDGSALIVMKKSATEALEIFELTPTATFIWKILEKKPKVKEVTISFAKKYTISPKSAKTAVLQFIKKLSKNELIELVNDIQ